MLFIQEMKPELNTQSDSIKTIKYLIITLFVPHCSVFFFSIKGGSVAEWLGRRTRNPEVTGSSPALAT